MVAQQLQSPMKACLPPVVDPGVRVLILGSLPGEASLAASRYYAHPRNQFWALLGTVLEEEIAPLAYEQRLQRLLVRGVGLWDTVARAERRGSLDGALREIAANPLCELVAGLPELRAIGFNGGTAARVGRAALGATPLALVDLPSSSPTFTLPLAVKAERWAALRRYAIDSR